LKLRRADRLVSRIIVTRSEGYISFAAVKWLRDVGIGLAQLDFNGDVIMATAQRSLDLASMRRAQCLAAGSDFGRSIVRELLQAKLDGQAAVARIPPAVSGQCAE
jgi:CRISPR/Cas system-associated endonuclease Cas1